MEIGTQLELLENESELIVFEPAKMLNVPSSTIHIENNISLLQKKLWFELVYHAFPKMGNQRKHTIKLQKLRELLGWDEVTSSDDKLKEALKGLSQTVVSWNIFGKDKKRAWEAFPLLAGCRIPENSGVCIFEFSSFLEERFLSMGEDAYVKIDLIISKKFQSKYALSIYCLALDYLMLEMGYSEKKFSIAELRRYLAIKEGEYKLTGDFNKRIIKPSEEEINTTSDMNIEIKPFKDGKKISGYKLCMSLKDGRAKEYLDRKNLLKNPSKEENKLAVIEFNNSDIRGFFSERNISITTESIQIKLHKLKNDLKGNLEAYMLFLMDYLKKEAKKGFIKNPSGFFVSLLQDDSQLENFMFKLEEEKIKVIELNNKAEHYVEAELKSRYENFLSKDFENYLNKNLDSLENIIKSIVEKIDSSAMHHLIILKKMGGAFTIEGYKKLADREKTLFLLEFKNHKEKFNYQKISFEQWKEKHVNKLFLDKIKEEVIKSKF